MSLSNASEWFPHLNLGNTFYFCPHMEKCLVKRYLSQKKQPLSKRNYSSVYFQLSQSTLLPWLHFRDIDVMEVKKKFPLKSNLLKWLLLKCPSFSCRCQYPNPDRCIVFRTAGSGANLGWKNGHGSSCSPAPVSHHEGAAVSRSYRCQADLHLQG